MSSAPPIRSPVLTTPAGSALTDPLEMLPMVARAAKLSEGYHLTTFRGYRRDRSGRMCEVTVEVMDRGPDHPHRYVILATDDLGRTAAGDGAGDLRDALASVRWYRLDREPPPEPG